MAENLYIPEISGPLRSFMLKVPEEIQQASGIRVMGKLIKSIVFTTDICIIRNVNADAVIAVFTGVGGGLTQGKRVVNLSMHAEFQGAIGVVVNAPTSNDVVRQVCDTIDIPVVVTVIPEHEDIESRLEAGAKIFNVSAAGKTTNVVREIRKRHPDIPIIATGGPTSESILATIEAGANAITWTPPTNGEVFRDIMNAYREGKPHP